MKTLSVIITVLSTLLVLSCSKPGMSEATQRWLQDYESVIDEYILNVDSQTKDKEAQKQLSIELDKKLKQLSQDAEKIRKDLKPGEAMYFFKEFGRITSKLSVSSSQLTPSQTNIQR